MPESVTSIIKVAQFGFQVADWWMDAIASATYPAQFGEFSAIASQLQRMYLMRSRSTSPHLKLKL
ncbi:hypothetical protein [Coleofasciculus sp. H7-2]|uniref:hypothetical protein n=1 Tax=Coleofasciculus sp. H7-2 TaxID=3351545 RepID=UPI0036702A9F